MADLRLPNIMPVVDKLRINYMNHTIWKKGDTKLREMLLEEHELNPNNSLLGNVDELCRLYKLPPVSSQELDPGRIKFKVKVRDEIDIWMSNLLSSATQNVGLERLRLSTNFYTLTKRQSQALIAYNAGAFKLKTAWGDYHEVKDCLAPLCDGKDELDHIKVCPHYETEWEEAFSQDSKQLSSYFVKVDRERRRRWRGECLF